MSARLRQERLRTGLNQKDFGALAGVGLQTQNRYENQETQPNAEYLGRLAEHGIDVFYVLTGRRQIADSLDHTTSAVIDDYLALPPLLKRIATAALRAIRDEASAAVAPDDGAGTRTLHGRQLEYHAQGAR